MLKWDFSHGFSFTAGDCDESWVIDTLHGGAGWIKGRQVYFSLYLPDVSWSHVGPAGGARGLRGGGVPPSGKLYTTLTWRNERPSSSCSSWKQNEMLGNMKSLHSQPGKMKLLTVRRWFDCWGVLVLFSPKTKMINEAVALPFPTMDTKFNLFFFCFFLNVLKRS